MGPSHASHLRILGGKTLIKTSLIEILPCWNAILMRAVIQYLNRWSYRWLAGIGVVELSILRTQAWVTLSIIIDILIYGTPQGRIDSWCGTSIERIACNVYGYLRQLTTFRGYTSVIVQMLILFVSMPSLIVVREWTWESHDVLLGWDLVVFPAWFWLLVPHGAGMTCLYLRHQSIKHVVINLFYSKRHFVLFAIWVLAYGAVIVGRGQSYSSLDLLPLANWPDFRSITQPELLLKLCRAVELDVGGILSGRSLVVGEERLFQGFDCVAAFLGGDLQHQFDRFVSLITDSVKIFHQVLLRVFCECYVPSLGKFVPFSPLVFSRCS